MADILIKAETEEQLEEFVTMLCGLMNFTGGWVGSYGEEDQLGDLEIRMIPCSASEEELRSIWERMLAGEAAGEAYRLGFAPDQW
jgi:hypothetical protein